MRNWGSFLRVAACLGVGAAGGLRAEEIVLRRGCGYSIVIAERPDPVVRFAAGELQQYVRAITGAELPIVSDAQTNGIAPEYLLLGDNAVTRALGIQFEDPTPEAFRIKTVGPHLVLWGDDRADREGDSLVPFSYFYSRKGTLFAVYDLLERLGGVRWFFPGPDGEVVPRADALTIPSQDRWERPDMPVRWFWSARGAEDVFTVPEEVSAHRALWLMRIRQGMPLNLGFRNGFAHCWGTLVEGNKHFEAHPEYYPYLGGGRQPVYTRADGTPTHSQNQVCTSNPEVARLFAAQLRARFKPEDEALVSVSPNDGGGYCECAACRALDRPELYGPEDGYQGTVLSDRVYTFVNQVARELKTTHPRLSLGIIAYTFYNDPPRTVPLLENNVMLRFIDQAENYLLDPVYRARMRRNLEEWSRRMSGPINVGQHYDDQNRVPVSQFLPLIAEHTRMLAGLGTVNGLTMETHAYLPLRHLDYYVLSRLMWDSRQDAEALVADYCRSGFGAAAPQIRRYVDFMNTTFQQRMLASGLRANPGSIHFLWLPEDLRQAGALLDEAEAAEADPAVRRRIGFLRQGVRFVALYREVSSLGAALDENGLLLNLVGLPQYPRHEFRGSLGEAERAALALRAAEALAELEAFLRAGCETPGLDPRQMWSSSMRRGDLRAIPGHAAVARGDTVRLLDTDFAGGKAPGWRFDAPAGTYAMEADGEAASGTCLEVRVPGTNSIPVMRRTVGNLKPGRSYVVSLLFRRMSGASEGGVGDAPGEAATWGAGPYVLVRKHSRTDGYLLKRHGEDCEPTGATLELPAGHAGWVRMQRVVFMPDREDFGAALLSLRLPPGCWRIGGISLEEVM